MWYRKYIRLKNPAVPCKVCSLERYLCSLLQLFSSTSSLLRRYDMNGRFQMQGGKNWILPKKMNANRFFSDPHWLGKSVQTTYFPVWDWMERAWLWTLLTINVLYYCTCTVFFATFWPLAFVTWPLLFLFELIWSLLTCSLRLLSTFAALLAAGCFVLFLDGPLSFLLMYCIDVYTQCMHQILMHSMLIAHMSSWWWTRSAYAAVPYAYAQRTHQFLMCVLIAQCMHEFLVSMHSMLWRVLFNFEIFTLMLHIHNELMHMLSYRISSLGVCSLLNASISSWWLTHTLNESVSTWSVGSANAYVSDAYTQCTHQILMRMLSAREFLTRMLGARISFLRACSERNYKGV
jgi:hypothetical protein